VGLPVVSKQIFEQKLKELNEEEDNKNSSITPSSICQVCCKKFTSTQTLEQHLKSNKHKALAAKAVIVTKKSDLDSESTTEKNSNYSRGTTNTCKIN